MRVTELIEKLSQMPPDAEVETEGCDCIGRAEGVRLESDGTVLIMRYLDEGERSRNALLYPSLIGYDDFDLGEQIEEAVTD